jgi:hypothetical protein
VRHEHRGVGRAVRRDDPQPWPIDEGGRPEAERPDGGCDRDRDRAIVPQRPATGPQGSERVGPPRRRDAVGPPTHGADQREARRARRDDPARATVETRDEPRGVAHAIVTSGQR